MSDSRVKCTFCGQVFMIDKEKAGASAPCPACGKETFLDMPDDPARLDSYQIKDSSGVTEDSRDCPACGAPVPAAAALCTQCGYNMETGQKKTTKIVKQGSLSRYAVPVLLMVIAAMATYIVEEARFKRELAKALAKPEEVATKAAPEQPAPAPVAETPAPAVEEPVAPAAEAQPAPVAGPTPEQQAAALAQREQKMRADLDQKSPLLQKDEQVTLVGKTGRVYRGKFFGVKDGLAVLAVEGRFEEVAFDQLSHDSRLRCDKTYREAYIKRMLQPRR
ncbi:MAG: hypothetical protein AB7T27_01325 [Kiritimatiellia bacterium]